VSLGEIAFLGFLVAVGIGYGIREYALFIACYRNPTPPFPYPPERLWQRLKLSALLILEALVLGATLVVARGGHYLLTALVLALLSLVLLVRLITAGVRDFRDTRAQHRALLDQARQGARPTDREPSDGG